MLNTSVRTPRKERKGRVKWERMKFLGIKQGRIRGIKMWKKPGFSGYTKFTALGKKANVDFGVPNYVTRSMQHDNLLKVLNCVSYSTTWHNMTQWLFSTLGLFFTYLDLKKNFYQTKNKGCCWNNLGNNIQHTVSAYIDTWLIINY